MKKISLILAALLLSGCSASAVDTVDLVKTEAVKVTGISEKNNYYMPIQMGERYRCAGEDGEFDFTVERTDNGYTITREDTGEETMLQYASSYETRRAEYMRYYDGDLYMLFTTINMMTGENSVYLCLNASDYKGSAEGYRIDIEDSERIHLEKNYYYGLSSHTALDFGGREDGVMDPGITSGTGIFTNASDEWIEMSDENQMLYVTIPLIVMELTDDGWNYTVLQPGTEVSAENVFSAYADQNSYELFNNMNADYVYELLTREGYAYYLPVNSEDNLLRLQDGMASTALLAHTADVQAEEPLKMWDIQGWVSHGETFVDDYSAYISIDKTFALELNENVTRVREITMYGNYSYQTGYTALVVDYADGYEEMAFFKNGLFFDENDAPLKLCSHTANGEETDVLASAYENSVFEPGTAICTGDSENGSYLYDEEGILKEFSKDNAVIETPDGYISFKLFGPDMIEVIRTDK